MPFSLIDLNSEVNGASLQPFMLKILKKVRRIIHLFPFVAIYPLIASFLSCEMSLCSVYPTLILLETVEFHVIPPDAEVWYIIRLCSKRILEK